MARLRAAPAAAIAPETQRTRQALKEKTNTAKSTTVYEFQENIEELVKPSRPRRGRPKQSLQDENVHVMAGGLGQRDTEAQSQSSDPPLTTDDLSKGDGAPTKSAKPNRRPPRMMKKAVQNEAHSTALADLKKRMLASNKTTSPAMAANRQSDLSSSASPSPPSKHSALKEKHSSFAQPTSALKSHNSTSLDTSILALKNFKRRPRQPSLLQMVQQRTASARPSLVNASVVRDPSGYDIEDVEDDDDEEDFAPDAEGTPLHVKKAARPGPSSPSRKRKSEELDLASSVPNKSRSKRHKPGEAALDGEVCVADTQPQGSSPERQKTPEYAAPSNVQVINSSPSSLLSLAPPSIVRNSFADIDPSIPFTEPEEEPGTRSEVEEREDQDGIMAEPLSSSPQPSGPMAQSTADIMADPLTQVSPPRARGKKKQKVKPMTTATLQSLLPRRRKRPQTRARKSEYDIDSDSEEADEQHEQNHSASENEEDDHGNSRTRRQTNSKPKLQPKGSKGTAAKSPAKKRQSKAPSSRKPAAPLTTTKRTDRTYSRARANTTTSDKENEGSASAFDELPDDDPSALPDTSISMIEAAQSAELEAARKKFADIDDWDMEFESMSYEEGRSSSQEWR